MIVAGPNAGPTPLMNRATQSTSFGAMPPSYGRARLAELLAWLAQREQARLPEGPDWRSRFMVFVSGQVVCLVSLAWGVVYLAVDQPLGALCMVELAATGLIALHMARRPRLHPAVLLLYLNAVLMVAALCIFSGRPAGAAPRCVQLFLLPTALTAAQLFEGPTKRYGQVLALLALALFLVFSCTEPQPGTGPMLPAEVLRWGAPLNALAALISLALALLATHTRISERSLKLAELRRAVSMRQFELHLQAQIGRNGAVVGAEGLLRWRHPSRGLLPPAEFIGLAESSGLIVPLGHWGLLQGCQLLASWRGDPRLEYLRLAINISAVQLQQPGFVAMVETLLNQTGAPPERLLLELTETVHLAEQPQIIERMHELALMGVGLSIDDFGTGYASLSYLQRLPLSQLKIDQSFVSALQSGARADGVCKSLIVLARRLRLSVTAEGVETEQQWSQLRAMGCDSFQGLLFSKALPAREFEALAGRRAARSAA